MRRSPGLLALAALAAAVPAPMVRAQDVGNATRDDPALIEQAIESGRLVQARAMLAHARLSDEAGQDETLDILTGELALAERRDGDALAAFAALKARGVADCRVGGGLGIALLRGGRGEEAVDALRAAAHACPDRWRIWNALGIALDLRRAWKESASAYETAYRLSDHPAMILNNYGYSLLLQHRFGEAARLFAAARRIDPVEQRYANNGDIARAMDGRPVAGAPGEEAEDVARRLNNAGYASLLAGRRDAAMAYFSRSLHAGDSYYAPAGANLAAMGEGK